MPIDLTDAEIDCLLERFDQTEPKLQRRIIAKFVLSHTELDVLKVKLESLERELTGATKARDLLLKGMESQSELMDGLKQKTREQETTITTLREINAELLAVCETALWRHGQASILGSSTWTGEEVDAMRAAVAKAKGACP